MAFTTDVETKAQAEAQDKKSDLGKVKFEVELIEDALQDQDGVVTPEEEKHHEEEIDGEDQTHDDYLLAMDRTKRTIIAPEMFGYVDLIAFALVSTSEVLQDEPKYVKSILVSKDSKKWKQAMNGRLNLFMLIIFGH